MELLTLKLNTAQVSVKTFTAGLSCNEFKVITVFLSSKKKDRKLHALLDSFNKNDKEVFHFVTQPNNKKRIEKRKLKKRREEEEKKKKKEKREGTSP